MKLVRFLTAVVAVCAALSLQTGRVTAQSGEAPFQDGDVIAGAATAAVPYWENTTGAIYRVRDGVATKFCEADSQTYWNVPYEVMADAQGRVVFLASLGSKFFSGQNVGLLRCNAMGQPAERLAVFQTGGAVPDGWPNPFPGLQVWAVRGLHLSRSRAITIIDHENGGRPQLANREFYVVGFAPGNSGWNGAPDSRYQAWQYDVDTRRWSQAPTIVDTGTTTDFDMFFHDGNTYSVSVDKIARHSSGINLNLQTSAGGMESVTSLSLFSGFREIPGGTLVDDLTVDNPPSGNGCSGTMPWDHGGFRRFHGPYNVIFDTFGSLGLVTANDGGGNHPLSTNWQETLLDLDPTNDSAAYFQHPYFGCAEVPFIGHRPAVGGSLVARNAGTLAPARGGVVAVDYWTGDILKYTASGPVRLVAAGTVPWLGGIGTYPNGVAASAGSARFLIFRFDSTVEAIVNFADGRRLGTDPQTGEQVNDFGLDGVVGEPGTPRFFAIRNPVPGEYTVHAAGEGACVIHVYLIDPALSQGAHTFGPCGELTFQLDEDGHLSGGGSGGGSLDTVRLSSTQYETSEGIGAATISIERTGGAGTLSVDFATAGGTANSDAVFEDGQIISALRTPDYRAVSGTVTFNAGETTKQIVIPIIDDDHIEGDETIQVTLTNAVGAQLGTVAALVTLHDNDPNISFVTSGAVGEEGRGFVDIEVALSALGTGNASVAYSVSGTASRRQDFVLADGVLDFTARDLGKTRTIRLRILDDDVIEPSETVVVTLANPVNVTLGPRPVFTYTIAASDSPWPDGAGNSPADARMLDFRQRPRQSAGDYLLSADVDVYRAHLNAGEFVAIDVDSTEPLPLRSSTLRVIDSDGTTVLAEVGRSQNPDSTTFTHHPATGFRAPHSGDYYFELRTANAFGTYRVTFHRIALAEGHQDPASLDEDGQMFVWLKGNRLSIAGPTGYGFSLSGAWTKSVTSDRRSGLKSTSYHLADNAPLSLETALGSVPIGSVATPVTIETAPTLWGDVFGVVQGPSIALDAGIPMGDLAEAIGDRFGAEFGTINLRDQWQIKLGATISGSTGFSQVLRGVPYLVYNDVADMKLELGPIQLAQKQWEALLILNPVDPSYGGRLREVHEAPHTLFKPESWQLSFQGLVPYRPSMMPSDASGAAPFSRFYGHGFATWEAPITPLPFYWSGQATIDIDANDDGTWLGGLGTANELLAANIGDIASAARDLGAGFEGAVFLDLQLLDKQLGPLKHVFPDTVRLGRASAFYNGAAGAIWFKAIRGPEQSPWDSSLFRALEFRDNDYIEGFADANGNFFLSATSLYTIPGNATLGVNLTLQNSGITASLNGDVEWKASATIDQFSASCTAKGDLAAALSIGATAARLTYAGSAELDGRVRCYSGDTLVASAGFNVSGSVEDGRLRFHLPLVGNVTMRLP